MWWRLTFACIEDEETRICMVEIIVSARCSFVRQRTARVIMMDDDALFEEVDCLRGKVEDFAIVTVVRTWQCGNFLDPVECVSRIDMRTTITSPLLLFFYIIVCARVAFLQCCWSALVRYPEFIIQRYNYNLNFVYELSAFCNSLRTYYFVIYRICV